MPKKRKIVLLVVGTKEILEPPDDDVEHEHVVGVAMKIWVTPPTKGLMMTKLKLFSSSGV